MTSERGEPRWELLPHNPIGFFELAEPFDRKTLKQRYTDLIRRFKPEKHPSEFQQIRAAFESLDARLRYGQQEQTGQAAIRYQWPATNATAYPAEVRPSRQQPVHRQTNQILSLAERLDNEEPSQLYEELERRESKSAYDYYALAVLSDLADSGKRLGFLRWILEGLKALPQEPALSGLLYELLRQNDFEDENADVLLTISRLFPSDKFYYLTESLWQRVIKRDSPDRFAATLEQCEANLRDHRIEAKVTFYVRILRTALWRAPEPWIERVLAFLAENDGQISGELEYEMELNVQLNRYRRMAHSFVNGSPQREKIDRCIREFCTVDERDAAQRLVQTQLELAADPHALLGALPFDDADYSAAYEAMRWISYSTDVRLGIDRSPPNINNLPNATLRFMKEVDALDGATAWQLHSLVRGVFELMALLVLGILVGFLVIPIQLLADSWLRMDPATSNLILVGTLIATMIATVTFYFQLLRKKTTDRWFDRWKERIGRRKYRRRWRDQVLRFVEKTQYPLEDIRETVSALLRQYSGGFVASTWLPGFMERDFGLAFYALAHRYER